MIPKIPADISLPDPILGTSSIIALIFSCLFIYLAVSRLKNLKLATCGVYSLFAILLLSASAIIMLTALNIHNYQRFTHENNVAEIHFSKLEEQLYRADVYFANSMQAQQFQLRGDEWQLDVRIIKWQAPLTVIGFNSLYTLDRIQGRYRDIEQEKLAPRTIYALNKGGQLDLWSLVKKHRQWLPWLDAFYGSGIYLPMENNANFEVKMTQTGLIARPVNELAETAVHEWD